MQYLARGRATGPLNPVLVFYGLDVMTGFLVDPEELTVEVFDVSSPEKWLDPVSVLAETPVTTGDRLSVGRFAPSWAPASDGAVGEHVVRWRYRMADGDERVVDETFEVLAKQPFQLGPLYSSVAAFRAAGLDVDANACTSTDARILALLVLASRKIEQITQRFFEPRWVDERVDGSDSAVQRYGSPIIAISSIMDLEGTAWGGQLSVYNRHLCGLARPDDRNDPRVARVGGIFYEGAQNIRTAGVFGYTDPAPGSLWGVTPPAIAQVTRMLAARFDQNPTLAGTAGPIAEERTRDQSVKYSSAGADAWATTSPWTGDAAIDSVLLEYLRPAFMGFA